MTETPPTDPIHRALWAMGFNEKQRGEIIAYCTAWAKAGIDIGPAEIGAAIMKTARIDYVFLGEAME